MKHSLTQQILLIASCMLASPAWADDPVFAITSYEISGNTLLPDSDLQAAVSAYTGKEKNFKAIQDALKAVETRYAKAGYASVRVMLPEQEVDNGKIQLKVIEAKIGKISVLGNNHFSSENIRASVPHLTEGSIPRMNDISASLRVANENTGKQTSLVFSPSAQSSEIDASLRVTDESPIKLGVSLDNTGTDSTGDYRLGLLVQHANLFNLDHIASAQIITSPGHQNDVKILGLGYKIPVYRYGDSIDIAYGYSNVDSGSVSVAGGVLGISGSGHIASTKYNFYLPKWQSWEQKLSLGLDFRAYSNDVTDSVSSQSLVPDITVHPVSLSYYGYTQQQNLDFSLNLSVAQNISGGSNGSADDFEASRTGASATYNLFRYGFNVGYNLPANWALRGTLAGQYSRDLLVSGEQFGAGGYDSVRGFDEREVAKDRGARASLELYTPDLAALIGLTGSRLQMLAFYDAARLSQNDPLPGEQAHENIASAGLGLRFSYARNLSIRLDYGVVTEAGGTRDKGDSRLHGSLLWFY
ncbi:MAG: ShlB/FhaC/HecB family hemolysin secretion/activation protein [Rhodocyclaceae bacterium]|nr:ShlB/FhaC/HecB family hemolysin secretion/activation protein [Rhodocyclaceae bacterium]